LELESESGCAVQIRDERKEEMKQVRAITNTASGISSLAQATQIPFRKDIFLSLYYIYYSMVLKGNKLILFCPSLNYFNFIDVKNKKS